jgi:hypothetical protein
LLLSFLINQIKDLNLDLLNIPYSGIFILIQYNISMSNSIEIINKALAVGEKSGKPLKYNYDEFLKKMAKKH